MDNASGPTRREFIAETLAACGIALSLKEAAAATHAGAPLAAAVVQEEGQSLLPIGEIVSRNGKLQAVITVKSGERMMPADTQAGTDERKLLMRYLEGKDVMGNVWPRPSPAGAVPPPLPGPTLRAQIGDQVEITLLNHVKTDDFGKSLDGVETGEVQGCDTVTLSSGKNHYPQGMGDAGPNCFHGSSTTNLHFHGTHVTPDGLGDNILLQLRPKAEVTELSVRKDFGAIFAAGPPKRWDDLPETWRKRQLALLKEHDDTAVWQGKRGTPGNPTLPPERWLLPKSEALIRAGLWPQYQIGAYPFCFQITPYPVDANGAPTAFHMGQCPGTHWYHAHKHGSTAINVYNGMAGVFIIEGDYDNALEKIYPNLRQTQKVLIVQNFSEAPNLMRQKRFAPSLWVNGRYRPTIAMRRGEIQLWRLVNASVRAVTSNPRFEAADGSTANAVEMRQIAQDGVQLRWENFNEGVPLKPRPDGSSRSETFAPGNRIDLLVKAPLAGEKFEFKVTDTALGDVTLLMVTLTEEPALNPPMEFPVKDNYPAFPCFLEDIPAESIRISRTLDFGWEKGRFDTPPPPPAPQFNVDGRQFRGDRYDQTMILGDCEEWTLTNSTAKIAHPFHIHVNPFQIVECYDPTKTSGPKLYKPEKNFLWQDVVAVPPALYENQALKEKGYVKIRHRFADFPGSFVLHCHMLAHEDRGMMQLVRVISNTAGVPHH